MGSVDKGVYAEYQLRGTSEGLSLFWHVSRCLKPHISILKVNSKGGAGCTNQVIC